MNPIGSVLKLGRISEDAVYTCRVFDRREQNATSPRLKTEVDIPVYVASSAKETCGENHFSGLAWQTTKKVNSFLN